MELTATLADNLRIWLPDDPGLSGLRRATRAAIVIPVSFAFAKLVFGNVQVTTFAAFGCFALLVMADFGGPRRSRAVAYVTTTLVGAGLVAVGTLVSPNAWVAALVMLGVGFWIQFYGVFGGYIAAAQPALLLSFVLAASVPASSGGVWPRLAGWFLAGVVSTLSGVFFWPQFERLHLRQKAAEAAQALATLLRFQRAKHGSSNATEAGQSARAAVAAARRQYARTRKRPAGPTRRDRAFVELLTDLERTLDLATRPFGLEVSAANPCIQEGNRLSQSVVQTLEASAAVLTGGTAPDLAVLNAALLAHREALDRWAAESLRAGTPPEDVLAGLDADHGLRAISYLSLAVGTNAIITIGGRVGDGTPLPAGAPLGGWAAPLMRIAGTIRTHLTLTSEVLRHSLRVGIGLALAVLLARELQLSHAFWVVLGTLSVLRSNALATGRTTIQALAGTVVGFAVGALFTILVGATSPVLWVALPAAVFLATYAASAIGFVVGQAAFTVLIIILFNLLSPVGWRVGLARIEDVAVGVGISLVTGLLLWPRGARGELGSSVAELYRAAAAYLASCFRHVLDRGAPAETDGVRRLAVEARDRAGESFDQFLNERASKPLDPATAGFLVAAGTKAIIAGDLLNVTSGMGYKVQGSSEQVAELRAQTQLMLAGFVRLADRLDGTTSPLLSGASVSEEVLREVAISSLRQWASEEATVRSAIAVVIAGEWLQQLATLAADLEARVSRAAEGVRVPRWR